MELPERKGLRLKYYSYNKKGAYFITICTKDKKEILSKIIKGTDILEKPQINLSYYGKIADKYIKQIDNFYTNISVEKYVIMPNHIHLLVRLTESREDIKPFKVFKKVNNVNSEISKFVSAFKRFCNKEYGENIWQSRYFDHVIRDDRDYKEIWQYIDSNPRRWAEKRQKSRSK